MDAMLQIGPSKESIEAAQNAIMAILGARADQKTIRQALHAFKHTIHVQHVSVTGNLFTSNPITREEVERGKELLEALNKQRPSFSEPDAELD